MAIRTKNKQDIKSRKGNVRSRETGESFWQFAIVNGRLAEVFFSDRKIAGFCYVKASEYKTKREKQWIASDTKKLQLSYRNKSFRNKLTKQIMPQARIAAKRGKTMTLTEIEKKFNLS